jgi:hypothetical protein
MGQSVLANQFIAGLHSDLKSKVVGTEGNPEQLLLKARFEEAKKRELALPLSTRSHHLVVGKNPSQEVIKLPFLIMEAVLTNAAGVHMARYCRYPRQPKEKEAHGRKRPSVVNVRSAPRGDCGAEERA